MTFYPAQSTGQEQSPACPQLTDQPRSTGCALPSTSDVPGTRPRVWPNHSAHGESLRYLSILLTKETASSFNPWPLSCQKQSPLGAWCSAGSAPSVSGLSHYRQLCPLFMNIMDDENLTTNLKFSRVSSLPLSPSLSLSHSLPPPPFLTWSCKDMHSPSNMAKAAPGICQSDSQTQADGKRALKTTTAVQCSVWRDIKNLSCQIRIKNKVWVNVNNAVWIIFHIHFEILKRFFYFWFLVLNLWPRTTAYVDIGWYHKFVWNHWNEAYWQRTGKENNGFLFFFSIMDSNFFFSLWIATFFFFCLIPVMLRY